MSKPKQTKASFIRGLSVALSIPEVIARGAAKGLSITKQDVYMQRHKQRTTVSVDVDEIADKSQQLSTETRRLPEDADLLEMIMKLGTQHVRSVLERIEQSYA